MSKRAVRHSKSIIDPMFFIPEGVDELEYQDAEYDLLLFADDEAEVDVSVDYEVDDDTDYVDTPETPQIFDIIPPQVFRMDDTGKEVVDVIFDVEEIPGATKYEFRITKL